MAANDAILGRLSEAIGQLVPENTGKGRRLGMPSGMQTYAYDVVRVNQAFRDIQPDKKAYLVIDVKGGQPREIDEDIYNDTFGILARIFEVEIGDNQGYRMLWEDLAEDFNIKTKDIKKVEKYFNNALDNKEIESMESHIKNFIHFLEDIHISDIYIITENEESLVKRIGFSDDRIEQIDAAVSENGNSGYIPVQTSGAVQDIPGFKQSGNKIPEGGKSFHKIASTPRDLFIAGDCKTNSEDPAMVTRGDMSLGTLVEKVLAGENISSIVADELKQVKQSGGSNNTSVAFQILGAVIYGLLANDGPALKSFLRTAYEIYLKQINYLSRRVIRGPPPSLRVLGYIAFLPLFPFLVMYALIRPVASFKQGVIVWNIPQEEVVSLSESVRAAILRHERAHWEGTLRGKAGIRRELFALKAQIDCGNDVGVFTVNDYGQEAQEGEKGMIDLLENTLGLNIKREVRASQQPQYIGIKERELIYGFVDEIAKAGNIRLFLTGGVYGDCIFKAFCIALQYAIFFKDMPIHIILVEQAIEAADADIRDLYAGFLEQLPVNTLLQIDGRIALCRQNNQDKGFAVIVDIYSSVAGYSRDYPQWHYVSEDILEADNYQFIRDILQDFDREQSNFVQTLDDFIFVTDQCGISQPQILAGLVNFLSWAETKKEVNQQGLLSTAYGITRCLNDSLRSLDIKPQLCLFVNEIIGERIRKGCIVDFSRMLKEIEQLGKEFVKFYIRIKRNHVFHAFRGSLSYDFVEYIIEQEQQREKSNSLEDRYSYHLAFLNILYTEMMIDCIVSCQDAPKGMVQEVLVNEIGGNLSISREVDRFVERTGELFSLFLKDRLSFNNGYSLLTNLSYNNLYKFFAILYTLWLVVPQINTINFVYDLDSPPTHLNDNMDKADEALTIIESTLSMWEKGWVEVAPELKQRIEVFKQGEFLEMEGLSFSLANNQGVLNVYLSSKLDERSPSALCLECSSPTQGGMSAGLLMEMVREQRLAAVKQELELCYEFAGIEEVKRLLGKYREFIPVEEMEEIESFAYRLTGMRDNGVVWGGGFEQGGVKVIEVLANRGKKTIGEILEGFGYSLPDNETFVHPNSALGKFIGERDGSIPSLTLQSDPKKRLFILSRLRTGIFKIPM